MGQALARMGQQLVTDIVLYHRATGRRIIVDTKFNPILTSGWHRPDSLRSGYIYHIYTYLRSQEGGADPLAATASGLLLHPVANQMALDEAVTIQGHEIRFATVDLAATASQIRARLLHVAGATE